MDHLWRRLIDRWRESGVAIQPGVDGAEVARFEAAHGVRLPDDLRSYLDAVNGTGQDMDGDLLRFWPLEEFRPVQEVSVKICPDCFVFADYCIAAWHYAVELPNGGARAGAVFTTGAASRCKQLTSSFREFIELYLSNPDNVV
jgi:hypothetical protein